MTPVLTQSHIIMRGRAATKMLPDSNGFGWAIVRLLARLNGGFADMRQLCAGVVATSLVLPYKPPPSPDEVI